MSMPRAQARIRRDGAASGRTSAKSGGRFEPTTWIYPAALCLGLFGYPLVTSLTGVIEIDNRATSVLMRAIVVLLMLAVVLQGSIKVREPKVYLVLAFWVLYSLRLAYELLAHGEIVQYLSNTEFLLFAYGTCLLPLLGAAMVTRRHADDLARAWTLIFVVVFVSTIANTVDVLQSGVSTYQARGRFFTTSLNPITYGALGSSLMLLCVFHLVINRPRGWRLGVAVAGALLGIGVQILSGSKGPMVASVAAGAFYLICITRGRDAWRYMGVIALAVAGVSVVTSLTASLFGQDPLARISSALQGDQSTDARLQLWGDSLVQYLDSPLLGSGVVEQYTGYYPHNIFVEGFIATGAIGGVLLLVIVGIGFVRARLVLTEQPRLGWIALLFVQQVTLFMFSNSLYAANQFWILLVLTLTVSHRRPRLGRQISHRRPVASARFGHSGR